MQEEEVWTTQYAVEVAESQAEAGPVRETFSIDATEDRMIVGVDLSCFNSVNEGTQANWWVSLGGDAQQTTKPSTNTGTIDDKNRIRWNGQLRASNDDGDGGYYHNEKVDIWDSDGLVVWEDGVTLSCLFEVSQNATTDNVLFNGDIYWVPLEEMNHR